MHIITDIAISTHNVTIWHGQHRVNIDCTCAKYTVVLPK